MRRNCEKDSNRMHFDDMDMIELRQLQRSFQGKSSAVPDLYASTLSHLNIWWVELCKDESYKAGYWAWRRWITSWLSSDRSLLRVVPSGARLHVRPLVHFPFDSQHRPPFSFDTINLLRFPRRAHMSLSPSGIMGAYGLGSTYSALNNCCAIPTRCTNLSLAPLSGPFENTSSLSWAQQIAADGTCYSADPSGCIMDLSRKWWANVNQRCANRIIAEILHYLQIFSQAPVTTVCN